MKISNIRSSFVVKCGHYHEATSATSEGKQNRITLKSKFTKYESEMHAVIYTELENDIFFIICTSLVFDGK